MATRTTQRYCLSCDRPVLAEKQRPNHILHLILSLLTCGLWLIVWLLLSLPSTPRCPHCGSRKTSSRIPRAAPSAALSATGVAAMPRQMSAGWIVVAVVVVVFILRTVGP